MKCKKCLIAAAILCATMACTALAGCGGAPTTSEPTTSAVVSQADTTTSSVAGEITMNGTEDSASTPAEMVGTYYWTRFSDNGKDYHTIEELLLVMQSDPNDPNYIAPDQVDAVRQQMESSCIELKADGTGSITDGKNTPTALLWSVASDNEIIFSNPAAPGEETDVHAALDRNKGTIIIDSSGDGTMYLEYTK